MTRIVVESTLAGSVLGLAVALAAWAIGRPLDSLVIGICAGIGAGAYAGIRAWRMGEP